MLDSFQATTICIKVCFSMDDSGHQSHSLCSICNLICGLWGLWGLVWWIELTAWFHHDYLSFRWGSASPPQEESATWMKLCPAWQTSFHCDFFSSVLSNLRNGSVRSWRDGSWVKNSCSFRGPKLGSYHRLLTCPVPGVKCPLLAFACTNSHETCTYVIRSKNRTYLKMWIIV